MEPGHPERQKSSRIILQARDPRWLHAYWKIGPPKTGRFILRVYEVEADTVTGLWPDWDSGLRAIRWFDVEINLQSGDWAVGLDSSGRTWIAELGIQSPNGFFTALVRSNVARTPPEGPSDWVAQQAASAGSSWLIR